MAIEISQTDVDGIAVLTLAGKATLGIGDHAIHTAIKDALEGGAGKIVIDMEGATAIDSSGIGELVSGTVSALKAQAILVFAAVPARMRKILEITHLVGCIVHYPTRDEARAAVAGMEFARFKATQRLRHAVE